MSKIIFGPSGLGGVKEAKINLESYSKNGLKACEIAFSHGIYLKSEDALDIGEFAAKHGIYLSIHAQYYINLNSKEPEKVRASYDRIVRCCEIGHSLSLAYKGKHKTKIVFHCGFYSDSKENKKEYDKELTFQNMKRQVLNLIEEIEMNKWNVELCPETMGKINVFGSVEEISRLIRETRCSCCIDFAHVLARYGKHDFGLVEKSFPQKHWHCHFSGIVYGDKGEKHHKHTTEEEWRELLSELNKLDKEITIINESPSPYDDSILGLSLI
ncbi:MAG: TIM barrel protein [archaeon]